jgi:hypothetical protein
MSPEAPLPPLPPLPLREPASPDEPHMPPAAAPALVDGADAERDGIDHDASPPPAAPMLTDGTAPDGAAAFQTGAARLGAAEAALLRRHTSGYPPRDASRMHGARPERGQTIWCPKTIAPGGGEVLHEQPRVMPERQARG